MKGTVELLRCLNRLDFSLFLFLSAEELHARRAKTQIIDGAQTHTSSKAMRGKHLYDANIAHRNKCMYVYSSIYAFASHFYLKRLAFKVNALPVHASLGIKPKTSPCNAMSYC